ncbi:Site-specific recombinase XerD [Granulicatella balaenopterae]|uniref:Site-specific recombinase XerD n=2 Tax=Granulicatella balaenopterae TaxID=137733 RepID=A0A1H9IQI7_9LACT|nr:Site-specific recombinase XerD [Granulicatella balaenopterae]
MPILPYTKGMVNMPYVHKRGKTWSYRVYYDTDDGKRKYVSKSGFKNKRSAKEAGELKKEELKYLDPKNQHDMLLADYMVRWMELYKVGKVSIKTIKSIETVINYVRKNYNLKLQDITNDNYQQFLNTLAKERSYATVKKYYMHTKAAITHAYVCEVIKRNPTITAIVTGNESKKMDTTNKYLHPAEYDSLEKALLDGICSEYQSRYVLLLAMKTGMRVGECLGLQWKYVDFDNNTVRVEHGFDYHHAHDFTDGKTKNAKRTIPVPEDLLELLNDLIVPGTHSNNRVFRNLSHNAILHCLQKACKRAKINRRIGIHALRHTYASILFNEGIKIAKISKLLGHADISITLQIYTHLLELETDDLDDQIRDIFK